MEQFGYFSCSNCGSSYNGVFILKDMNTYCKDCENPHRLSPLVVNKDIGVAENYIYITMLERDMNELVPLTKYKKDYPIFTEEGEVDFKKLYFYNRPLSEVYEIYESAYENLNILNSTQYSKEDKIKALENIEYYLGLRIHGGA